MVWNIGEGVNNICVFVLRPSIQSPSSGYFAQENVVLPPGVELPPPPLGIVLPTDEEELATEEKSQ